MTSGAVRSELRRCTSFVRCSPLNKLQAVNGWPGRADASFGCGESGRLNLPLSIGTVCDHSPGWVARGGWAAQQSHTLPLWQSSFVHVAGAACHESFCRSAFSHTALDVLDVWDKCMVVHSSHRTQPCALNSSPTTASPPSNRARVA